ncbi:MAG: glycoside hydrolase family 25 protein [Flavobacterium sp.]|nr:glycoside hydrolase family 25 protein [Flavobacterium sp.]
MATRKRISKKKVPFYFSNIFWILLSLAFFGLTIYVCRSKILFYLSFKSDKLLQSEKQYQLRNELVLLSNDDKVVGLDVSHYQGVIDWRKVKFINQEKYPIQFVFVRATQGIDKNDSQFENNWKQTKINRFVRGAYHYYRPNENSIEQAKNFIKTVKLSKGDLPPVLDIEKLPENQSIENLKIGLRRFLEKIEKHYKIKPIIYSGERYYLDFLKDEFSEYSFWIANYNFIDAEVNKDYEFWQFTEQAKVKGISEKVDVNIFNGNLKELNDLRIN